MKKLFLLAAVGCMAITHLTAQISDKIKTNATEIKPVAAVAKRRAVNECCGLNPYILTQCSQSLLQSFKNLTNGVGVRNCHPSVNFPSVSFAMPENCFSLQTTSASMVTYSSFYIPESKTWHGLSSEFRVIWGSSPGSYAYYGVCPPEPIIFPHPGVYTENHVFGAKLIKQSDYRAFPGPVKDYNTMAGVAFLDISDVEILAVYMEENGGYISTTEPSLYNQFYSSKGIVVSVKLRNTGSNVLCYIINNYDGAGTITWKERNPACTEGVFVSVPASISSFTAKPLNKTINLKWSVQNEQNTKSFEIQRFETIGNDFKSIASVESKSNGTANHQYEFDDKNVQTNLKYSYRIKLINIGGSFSYSPIATAIVEADDKNVLQISPNPVVNTLKASLNVKIRQKVNLKIINQNGEELQIQNEFAGGGQNINVNTSTLIAGYYFLVIEGSDGNRYAKVFQKK